MDNPAQSISAEAFSWLDPAQSMDNPAQNSNAEAFGWLGPAQSMSNPVQNITAESQSINLDGFSITAESFGTIAPLLL
ncbi:MAG TPA: hypothetical protein V6C84_07455 [Coleofasciculaceae cyanobacterium]|jgi:hypothetical protein